MTRVRAPLRGWNGGVRKVEAPSSRSGILAHWLGSVASVPAVVPMGPGETVAFSDWLRVGVCEEGRQGATRWSTLMMRLWEPAVVSSLPCQVCKDDAGGGFVVWVGTDLSARPEGSPPAIDVTVSHGVLEICETRIVGRNGGHPERRRRRLSIPLAVNIHGIRAGVLEDGRLKIWMPTMPDEVIRVPITERPHTTSSAEIPTLFARPDPG
mmetsp:Transcript_16665/g.34227  ORF Transcript_16665/g.34227 Transcript_16665/m.34227 type:complete len:210 (-) Transcript_16665:597-1226(-)